MKRNAVLLFIYNSFKDPLFQNILLSYIKEIQLTGNAFKFHVITFEQEEYKISNEEKELIIAGLAEMHIVWHPLKFHTGRFLLFKKLWDMMVAIVKVGLIRLKHKTKIIFAFANVAASYSYLLSRLLSMKLIIYSYEPHSEFMAELGVWSKESLKYKILKGLEDKAGQHAEIVLTGTKYMVDELSLIRNDKKVFRAPTGVDESTFYFNPEAHIEVRKKLNIQGRKVVLYIGKFGDLYYKEEVIAFFKGLIDNDASYFFIVITRYDHSLLKKWFDANEISEGNYFITGNLSDAEIKQYMSAADIGISAVPPSPSQKYRSPTKVGEYLMCGLPFVTCIAVSEDDIYAQKYNVGIVVPEFSKEQAIRNFKKIDHLISDGKNDLRTRCRMVGIEYRSKKKVVKIIKDKLDVLNNSNRLN